MIEIKICPNCGSNKIRKICRDWTDEVKGQTYLVPSLEFYECPECDEKVYDRWAMRKIESYSPAFSKKRTKKRVA
jgi:YgiT-type zinc finger domain-containing protein